MSEEQLKALIAKVQGDTSLQEKLKAASDADAVVAIAKDAGLMITAEEFKNAQAEVSDEELEGAAGGREVCPKRTQNGYENLTQNSRHHCNKLPNKLP